MADRVDRYFSDYYSGVFEAEIKNAKKSISERDSDEDKMRLAHYEEEVFIIENFLNTISDEEKKIMSMRLDRRKKKSWIELSSIMMQSESNLRRKFKAIKTSFENNFLGIEIKKPEKFVEMTKEQYEAFVESVEGLATQKQLDSFVDEELDLGDMTVRRGLNAWLHPDDIQIIDKE